MPETAAAADKQTNPYPDQTTDNPLERRAALAASGLLHPAALPTWAFAYILFAVPAGAMPDAIGLGPQARLWLLAVLSLLTLWLPMAMLAVAYSMGLVGDWQLRPKADRAFSLWLTAGLYGAGTWALMDVLPLVLFHLVAGLAGLALLKAVINHFYRLSGHGLGMAAFAGYWAATAARTAHPALVWPLVACVLGVGLLAWARLTLGAHRPGELLAGLSLGLAAGAGVGLWN